MTLRVGATLSGKHLVITGVTGFVGKTVLLRGTVRTSNPSGQVAVAVDGSPDCVVFGHGYDPVGFTTGQSVFIGVRPEDVEVFPATASEAPSGMVGGVVETSLFIGERIEYQVNVDGQRMITMYGDRHEPVGESDRVWLKLRPEGHSAWATETSLPADLEAEPA